MLAILRLNFDLAFKAEIRSRYWIQNSNQDKADGLALLREKTQECEDVEKFVAKVSGCVIVFAIDPNISLSDIFIAETGVVLISKYLKCIWTFGMYQNVSNVSEC